VSKAGRFAAVYAALRTMHDLGDHLVQTDRQAAGKASDDEATWVPAMTGHVVTYTAVQVTGLALVNRTLGLRLHPGAVTAAVALSASTHAFLDRRWPVRRAMELTRSPGFATGTAPVPVHHHGPDDVQVLAPVPLNGPYLADQALHHGVLFFAAIVAVFGER
jgi:hypothetical protein